MIIRDSLRNQMGDICAYELQLQDLKQGMEYIRFASMQAAPERAWYRVSHMRDIVRRQQAVFERRVALMKSWRGRLYCLWYRSLVKLGAYGLLANAPLALLPDKQRENQ